MTTGTKRIRLRINAFKFLLMLLGSVSNERFPDGEWYGGGSYERRCPRRLSPTPKTSLRTKSHPIRVFSVLARAARWFKDA